MRRSRGSPGDTLIVAERRKPPGTRGYLISPKFKDLGKSRSRYVTDYLTDKAVDFIGRNSKQPFFLYFAYHTPHTPIQGRADLVKNFEAKARKDAVHKNPTYAAMVKSLDMSVGRVLAQLEKSGVAERTLVVFTSDNGGLTQRYGKHDGFTENLPLRRGKGSAYEGGVRVPTIVHLPGVTKAGTVCEEPVSTIDWYPTLLELTGSKDATHNKSMDGVSLARLLRDSSASLDRNLYWHYPHYHAGGDGPYSAVRSGEWRLIEFHETGATALYNLSDDIGEQHNLAKSKPEKAAALLADLRAWRKRVGAQMPTLNPDFDPKKATQVRR